MADLEALIKEVIVYADRALVSRQGSIALEAGEHELRVNNLPQFIHDSLRASGQGPQGTRILNVDITTAFYSRPPEAELAALYDELEQLQQQRQLLKAQQESLNDRRHWLKSLGEQSRDFARGLAQGQMKPDDCAEFFRFMAGQALQDAQAAQDLQLQVQKIQQEIDAKQREISQREGSQLPDRQAALVLVEMAQAGTFTLELSYLVMGASWHPQYDLRVQVDEEGSSGTVELTYTGMVQQITGERWENVQLALSTARPSLAAILPELTPWYLNSYTPPQPIRPAAAPMMARMSAPAPGGAFDALAAGNAEIQAFAEEPIAAEIATTTVEHTGSALVFRAGRSVDIPSDNSPHKTTIARDNLPCTFDYVSAPALEEQTHMRATITNTTERVLLQGEASIFQGGEYVGTTQLKHTAPTEEFKVFLGLDDDIKVKRELIERAVDKGNLLQTDIRRITYAYRITVHNYAAFPRRVSVRDHLPVSQHERIKVKVQQIHPQPVERTKLELLKWKFTLAPGEEVQIEYRFTVEHPQSMKVIGLP